MNISRAVYEEGLKVEQEHRDTYLWLLTYYRKNKKFPKEEEFFLHIVDDHLKESPTYYTKLKDAKL